MAFERFECSSFLAVLLCCLLVACGDDAASPDSGMDASADLALDAGDGGAVEPREVTPTLGADSLGEIDPRYISVAVDMAQVVGGEFWAEDGSSGVIGGMPVPEYDFTRPRLVAMAQALAPAILRIGGSEADRIWYDMSDAPGEAPEGYEEVLTAAQFDGLFTFADATGFDIMFTVNGGPSARNDEFVWQPDNARVLFEYAADQGHEVTLWELANEPNAFSVVLGSEALEAEQYAADLQAFRALLDETLGSEERIGGLSAAVWPTLGEAPGPISEATLAAGAPIDVFTWHYYPQQSSRCPFALTPAEAETLMNEPALDEVASAARVFSGYVDTHAPGIERWLGETGHAQCGGAIGLSETFASSFWWLDQLGLLATEGHRLQIRQTLSGSNYGLIDESSTQPRPDYWASLLWRRLMGQRVLEASESDDQLRLYAHCSAESEGAVTWLAINLGTTDVEVAFEGTQRRYLVEADSFTSNTVRLNGAELQLDGDAVPVFATPDESTGALMLPARSYAFVEWTDAAHPACL